MSTRIGGVRTPYNYDVNLASVSSGLSCSDSTRTQQQFKEECDINTIIERFGLAAQVPENFAMPTYGDFTHTHDYHSAMNMVAESNESFESLPASIRERFSNDPGALMHFMYDPANRAEAEKLGLVRAVAPPPVVPVAVPATSTVPVVPPTST